VAIKKELEKLFAQRDDEHHFHYLAEKYERKKQVEELNQKLQKINKTQFNNT
jgi:hypothetical protein